MNRQEISQHILRIAGMRLQDSAALSQLGMAMSNVGIQIAKGDGELTAEEINKTIKANVIQSAVTLERMFAGMSDFLTGKAESGVTQPEIIVPERSVIVPTEHGVEVQVPPGS